MPPGVIAVAPVLWVDQGAFQPPLLESTELTLEKKTGESEESDLVREMYLKEAYKNNFNDRIKSFNSQTQIV